MLFIRLQWSVPYNVLGDVLQCVGLGLSTSTVLRLECSIDCISGSVGHQQNIFRSFFHCQRFF